MSAKRKTKPQRESAQTPSVDVGALARLFNLTSVRIGQLAKEGVVVRMERGRYDLWQSIRNYIRFLQERKLNQHQTDGEDIGDYPRNRARLTRAKAEQAELQVRILKGDYVERKDVNEIMRRIGAVVAAGIRRMEADLPPMLAGMGEAQMQAEIRGKVDDVLMSLSDVKSELWNEQQQQ